MSEHFVVVVNAEYRIVATSPETQPFMRLTRGNRLAPAVEELARTVEERGESFVLPGDILMSVSSLLGPTDSRTALLFQKLAFRAHEVPENR